MRVLHVIASMDTSRGGPPRSTYSLCLELARCGHDVALVTRSAQGWSEDSYRKRFDNGGQFSLVVVTGIDYFRTLYARIAWSEIVHFQSVWALRHALGAARCRRLRRPYLLAPRGELDTWSLQQKRLKKRVYLALVGRRLIRGCAAMHMLNGDEAAAFRALGIEQRTIIVPNGVDPGEWALPPREPPVRERYPQIGKRLIVLFFSRMHHKKGGAILAEAFARVATQVPESFIVFAGPDYGERRRIENLLRAGGVEERSLVLDTQDGESRRRLLMDADIVALPSFQEGHSRLILEAGFLGKGLLVTRECHVPELVRANAVELVEPAVDSVHSGLLRLLTDRQHRLATGRRARAEIRSNYTWATVARNLMDSYEKLLSGGTPRVEG